MTLATWRTTSNSKKHFINYIIFVKHSHFFFIFFQRGRNNIELAAWRGSLCSLFPVCFPIPNAVCCGLFSRFFPRRKVTSNRNIYIYIKHIVLLFTCGTVFIELWRECLLKDACDRLYIYIYIYIYYSVRCSPAKPRQCSTCSEGAE